MMELEIQLEDGRVIKIPVKLNDRIGICVDPCSGFGGKHISISMFCNLTGIGSKFLEEREL
jgi:hypothetical protein